MSCCHILMIRSLSVALLAKIFSHSMCCIFVLNFIFIGKYGYIAAGYTTLAGYVVLFLIHYNTICKLGYKKLFDLKTILTCLVISFPMILIFELIYKNNIIRYILFVIYMILFIYILFINKKRIKKLLRG